MDAVALAEHRLLWQDPLLNIAEPYPLRVLNSLPNDELHASSILWTYSDRSSVSDQTLQSLVEGLTLLACLAQTDAAAWLRELQLVWEDADNTVWIDEHLAPLVLRADAKPWVVGAIFPVSTEGCLDFIEDYILDQEETSRHASEAFETLYNSGLASWTGRPTVPICLELDFDYRERSEQRRVLRRLVEIAKLQATQAEPSKNDDEQAITGRMYISNIRFMSDIDVKDIEQVAQLGKLGIGIDVLPQLHTQRGSQISSKLVRSLQSLLHIEPDTSRGARAVTVTDETPHQLNFALLSALHVSQCVHTVYLTTLERATNNVRNGDPRESLWSAVASALCSPGSKHSIQTLELSLNGFHEADFEVFRSTYDFQQSGNSARVTDVPPSSRRLVASRFHLVKPSHSGTDSDDVTSEKEGDEEEGSGDDDENRDDDHEETDSDEDHEDDKCSDGDEGLSMIMGGPFDSSSVFESHLPLDVCKVDNDEDIDEEWCTVILPGAGRAWVRRDEVQRSYIKTMTNTTAPGFGQIIISTMTEASMDSVANLLCLIGNGTTQLSVVMFDNTTEDSAIDQWCVQVLSSCRKLERMELESVPLRDLRLVVDCIVRERLCIRYLSLGYVQATSLDHVFEFFRVLGDARHPFTTQLNDLRLVLVIDNEEDLMEPLIQMLKENRTLHTFSIGLRQGYNPQAPQRAQQSSYDHLYRYLEEEVTVRASPLDLQSKWAFISAVHGESALRSSCRGEIDTSIMSNIFQLAAPSRVRRVTLLNARES